MGQKVHPHGFRLGVIRGWGANWYSERKDFSEKLLCDVKVRLYLDKHLSKASISKITIERPTKSLLVTLYSSRPGMILGKRGEEIERLKQGIARVSGISAQVKVVEVKRPELDSKLVADSVAGQLERRILFRRAMKRAIQSSLKAGAKGIKIRVSGRLNGAEIARCEWYREGQIPLHTLRADVDYAESSAQTTYGIIGVKVWIFKGEVFEKWPERILEERCVDEKVRAAPMRKTMKMENA